MTTTTGREEEPATAGREQALGAGVLLALLAALWAGVGLGAAGWLAGIAYAALGWPVLAGALRRSRRTRLGPADRVTLARAVLVGGVAALVADGAAGAAGGAFVTALVALSAVALVLDGVDGYVARRTGTASTLGARFDMEVDALLILVLSVHAAFALGPWTLAIGAMRYVFAAAARPAPWLRSDLPPSTARKAVAALQGVVLAAAAAELLPVPAAASAVGLSLALLAWSFGRDTAWLWRHRAGARTGGAAAGRRGEPHRSACPPTAQTPLTAPEADDGAFRTRVLAQIPGPGRDPLRGPARARAR